MTQAEKETIETFKREFYLALRQTTGRIIEFDPKFLPVYVEDSRNSNDKQKILSNSCEKDEINARVESGQSDWPIQGLLCEQKRKEDKHGNLRCSIRDRKRKTYPTAEG